MVNRLTVVFQFMIPQHLADGYQHFGGTYYLNLQHRSNTEDGTSMFL
jgi:hypothetical protein